MSEVCAAYRANSTTDATFGHIVKGADPTTGAVAPQAGGLATSSSGGNPLAAELNVVAKCVKAGVSTRVYMVKLGGFDTHADERGPQQQLLQTLDDALTPFLRQMRTNVHGKNLVVLVYSEFGRRVTANASQGTDHGTAGPVFIAGAPVKGGFYGDQPSLTNLDDGDLKATTDFRDIYHGLLGHTIGTDPTPSVGTGRRDLGFL